MNAWLKGIFTIFAVIAALVLALPWGLYWYGASALPRELVPANRTYSTELRQMYWRLLGGEGDIRIRRLNPVTVAVSFVRMSHDPGSNAAADLQALANTSRVRSFPLATGANATRRISSEIAYEIRISQEWTPEQVIDTTLAETWLGRGATGMDAAAPAYFNAPLSQLTEQEQLSLLILSKAPSFFDPSCRRERFAARYRFLAARLGMEASPAAVETALARLRSITCS